MCPQYYYPKGVWGPPAPNIDKCYTNKIDCLQSMLLCYFLCQKVSYSLAQWHYYNILESYWSILGQSLVSDTRNWVPLLQVKVNSGTHQHSLLLIRWLLFSYFRIKLVTFQMYCSGPPLIVTSYIPSYQSMLHYRLLYIISYQILLLGYQISVTLQLY